jgi:membrane-associated phospholipid phosphatase
MIYPDEKRDSCPGHRSEKPGPVVCHNRFDNAAATVILAALLLLSPVPNSAQSPYETDLAGDAALVTTGFTSLGISFYLDHQVMPLTEEEVAGLSKDRINVLDRWVCSRWSPKASKASDIVVSSVLLSPLAMLMSGRIREDAGTVGLMYAETLAFSLAGAFLTKGLFKRIRPAVYNPDVPMDYKVGNSEARKSFYSGHTTMAFSAAVFTAKVYSDFYPDSDWRPVVWATTLSAASTVGVLRMLAGKHFTTDVLAGAATGAFLGYLVPAIHKRDADGALNSSGGFIIAMSFPI